MSTPDRTRTNMFRCGVPSWRTETPPRILQDLRRQRTVWHSILHRQEGLQSHRRKSRCADEAVRSREIFRGVFTRVVLKFQACDKRFLSLRSAVVLNPVLAASASAAMDDCHWLERWSSITNFSRRASASSLSPNQVFLRTTTTTCDLPMLLLSGQ